MADKKKKIFPSKESSSPRRPVILKSDRDVGKEPSKEKSEKEKQPTILLKSREPSTPKDNRAHSPKTIAPDAEIQPSKIVQNENKEKKEPKLMILPALKMKEPLKLLDENLEFNSNVIEYLQDSSSNFLVVGIMGAQGVGKSMILNLIAHDKSLVDICSRILTSHEIPSTQSPEETDGPIDQMKSISLNEEVMKDNEISDLYFKFKMQNIDQIQRGSHCTRGIDMYITEDRVILVDCQPLSSPSLLEENSGFNNSVGTHGVNAVTIECLQIMSYLMSICHVIIAVQDWFTDYNFLRYIQTAEMLRPPLSASHIQTTQDGGESTNSGQNNPHLLLLHNRCILEDFTPDHIKEVQELYRKAFQKSNLKLNSGLYLYNDSNRNGINIDNVHKGYTTEKCGTPINLFLLPEISEDFDNKEIYRGHPSFEKLAQRLRWMVLGVHRHQITNIANLSERAWYQFCNKAWETIRKSTFFMEYERFLP